MNEKYLPIVPLVLGANVTDSSGAWVLLSLCEIVPAENGAMMGKK